mgnify:FL=1
MAQASGRSVFSWIKSTKLLRWEYAAMGVAPLILMLINRVFQFADVGMADYLLGCFSFGVLLGWLLILSTRLLRDIYRLIRKKRDDRAQ